MPKTALTTMDSLVQHLVLASAFLVGKMFCKSASHGCIRTDLRCSRKNKGGNKADYLKAS